MSAHATVSLLGLGRMGSAIASCLAGAGVPLTVWNRSPARARAFEGRAAIGMNVSAACAASELIVVSLSDYAAALEVLDDAAGQVDLQGRTLVQLSRGTASDARTLEAWTRMHGMHYLDGAILAYPDDVGREESVLFWAGDEAQWERHRPTLGLLGGRHRYLGEEIGAAATLDSAVLTYYYGATAAMLQGAALCDAERLPLTEYFYIVKAIAPLLTATADQARSMIPREQYAGTEATLDTHLAALRHIQRTCHDTEIDTRLVDTLMQMLRKAVTSGYGDDEIAAVFEMLRRG